GAVRLLRGTAFEIGVNVVGAPTLAVTSTGDAGTSAVAYTAPVLDVVQGGRSLGRLDAANPRLDIPVGVAVAGDAAGNLPVIGDLLGSGQRVGDAVARGLRKIDIGVIRLSIGQLDQKSQVMTEPFAGFQLGATARLLDVQVLPTAALGLAKLPSALAQVTLGEQVARAYAPTGGVECGRPAGQPAQPPEPRPVQNLAYSTAQYQTIPMFWGGTAMLLMGVVLVAAVPGRRPRMVAAHDTEPGLDPADKPEPDPKPADKPEPEPKPETAPEPEATETDETETKD
ncbi:MAG TPA: hypothetical protein VFV67_26955, partial [Actinophytocola sp.]|nr:hypothetical protein [Actinophytocola sp.]